MRRLLLLVLGLALICPCSVSAAEPEFVILTFEGLPSGAPGKTLLEGLAQRDAHATFFLWAPPWEQGRRVLDGGHEIGLQAPESLNSLSRRQVAAKLREQQALLPPCQIRYLTVPGNCSDGVRQVARIRHLRFPPGVLDPWAEHPMGQTFLSRVRTGDTLYLRPATGEDVEQVLNLLDLLQKRGFRMISLKESAGFCQVPKN